jgi:hypothetical protein
LRAFMHARRPTTIAHLQLFSGRFRRRFLKVFSLLFRRLFLAVFLKLF